MKPGESEDSHAGGVSWVLIFNSYQEMVTLLVPG